MAKSGLLLMLDQEEAEEIRAALMKRWNDMRRNAVVTDLVDMKQSNRIEGIVDALDDLLDPNAVV